MCRLCDALAKLPGGRVGNVDAFDDGYGIVPICHELVPE